MLILKKNCHILTFQFNFVQFQDLKCIYYEQIENLTPSNCKIWLFEVNFQTN